MAASPWHTLDKPKRHCEDQSSPDSSPALINLNLNWKTPLGGKERRRQSPPPVLPPEDEDEVENAARMPKLAWNKPTLTPKTRTAPLGLAGTDPIASPNIPDKLEVKTAPPAASSSSSPYCPYEDDGDFELESVLLDEEEFSVPQYNKHRTRTGLRGIDEILTMEASESTFESVDEDEEGLSCGSLLELIGTPGSGKTTLLIQMAVIERLSSLQRARGAGKGKITVKAEEDEWMFAIDAAVQVTLIDTEGSISMDRILRFAEEHIDRSEPNLPRPSKLTLLRSVLSGIHYIRCTSDYELLAILQTALPASRRAMTSQASRSQVAYKDVKPPISSTLPLRTSLILIDSLSYHLRSSIPNEAQQQRNQRLHIIDEFRLFCERSSRRGIKVIFSNQMGITFLDRNGNTTNLTDKEGEGYLVPVLRQKSQSILGEHIWRVLLFRAGDQTREDVSSRYAYFYHRPPSAADSVPKQGGVKEWIPYSILEGNIEDARKIAS